ncbi:MAG: nuclear transport factor 2 family protein [Pyrinomonadaceae bacterium]
MKILLLTFALAVTIVSGARGQTTAPEPGKPLTQELELKALDLSWHEAVAARDLEALGRLLADDYQFDLDARRMLSKAQEVAAVGASDPLFDFGAFKLGDVSVRVEGERATVSGILITRPAGADKKVRLRYFYTRALIRRDDRWQILSSRLVSLAAGER